ncbi:MAG: T9SS type A sorting domain-containing protein [Bacteroidota bacterium]
MSARLLFLSLALIIRGDLFAQTIRTDGAVIHVGSSTAVITPDDISIQQNGSIQNSGTVYLGGDWTNNGLGLVGSLPGTIDFNGNQSQFIGGSNITNFSFLRISNPIAVSLSNNTHVNQTLIFNAGKINTGPYEVRMNNAPANPILGADANKYVNGNLRVAYNTTSPPIYKYEIGSNVYAPLELVFNNVTVSGSMVASTTNGASSLENFPTLGASGINPAARVNRHWSLSQSGLVYSTYDAGFDYSYSPFTGVPFNYQVRRYTPQSGWQTELSVSNGANALGVAGDGIFVIGELSNTSIMESPFNNLLLAPNPSVNFVNISGLNSLGPDVRLAIVDLLGREVWVSLKENADTLQLSLKEMQLKPGCYLFVAKGANGSGTARLIIQND